MLCKRNRVLPHLQNGVAVLGFIEDLYVRIFICTDLIMGYPLSFLQEGVHSNKQQTLYCLPIRRSSCRIDSHKNENRFKRPTHFKWLVRNGCSNKERSKHLPPLMSVFILQIIKKNWYTIGILLFRYQSNIGFHLVISKIFNQNHHILKFT